MHDNITRVAERGERLDALQDKTGECGVFGVVDMVTLGRRKDCRWRFLGLKESQLLNGVCESSRVSGGSGTWQHKQTRVAGRAAGALVVEGEE